MATSDEQGGINACAIAEIFKLEDSEQRKRCASQGTYFSGDFMRDPEDILGRSDVTYTYSMGREVTMFYEFFYVVLLLLFTKMIGMHLVILA